MAFGVPDESRHGSVPSRAVASQTSVTSSLHISTIRDLFGLITFWKEGLSAKDSRMFISNLFPDDFLMTFDALKKVSC